MKISKINGEHYVICDSTYGIDQDIMIYHKRLNSADGDYIAFAQIFETNKQTKLVETVGYIVSKAHYSSGIKKHFSDFFSGAEPYKLHQKTELQRIIYDFLMEDITNIL